MLRLRLDDAAVICHEWRSVRKVYSIRQVPVLSLFLPPPEQCSSKIKSFLKALTFYEGIDTLQLPDPRDVWSLIVQKYFIGYMIRRRRCEVWWSSGGRSGQVPGWRGMLTPRTGLKLSSGTWFLSHVPLRHGSWHSSCSSIRSWLIPGPAWWWWWRC